MKTGNNFENIMLSINQPKNVNNCLHECFATTTYFICTFRSLLERNAMKSFQNLLFLGSATVSGRGRDRSLEFLIKTSNALVEPARAQFYSIRAILSYTHK